MPVMAAARSQNIKAMFVSDKIRVDGHTYGVNDIHRLPANLNPEQGCIKESEDTICFFGKHTPLSNFYDCKFKVDGHEFNCVEQFLQKSKAEIMGSDETAAKILVETDPAIQKHMGDSIQGDTKKWKSQARKITYKAIKAKFQQNDDLLQYLLSSGKKHLAEASRNQVWGTGSTLRNPHVLDKNSWTGKNWLGDLLMKARDELK
jgi:ribA/ribD-fused uncharacterized protein